MKARHGAADSINDNDNNDDDYSDSTSKGQEEGAGT
jgi:hypothetical protein